MPLDVGSWAEFQPPEQLELPLSLPRARLAKPTLSLLGQYLRNPDHWPLGFKWDWGDCRQCAMGLALRLWRPNQLAPSDCDRYAALMAKMFSISEDNAKELFLYHEGLAEFTAGDVADKIDDYLYGGESYD